MRRIIRHLYNNFNYLSDTLRELARARARAEETMAQIRIKYLSFAYRLLMLQEHAAARGAKTLGTGN